MERQLACRVDDLADGECLRADTDPPVAVYRVGGAFYATADSCSHEEWSLGEEGEVDGFEVTCSLHMARFDVRDGRALCLPAIRALETYAVEVVDGDVFVAHRRTADTPAV
ncbi:non-heme iron oxygenase ferredoxin subunit [Dactylosporangium sp. NPDC005572]|uniref:non-heme iron oxygenase ferredoxin subunit n=1 Tax=Dactylosporangium sp. NPDC005572 TaxID=3156889 RepID=UPI0033B532C6